jgi:hypothetical protein
MPLSMLLLSSDYRYLRQKAVKEGVGDNSLLRRSSHFHLQIHLNFQLHPTEPVNILAILPTGGIIKSNLSWIPPNLQDSAI